MLISINAIDDDEDSRSHESKVDGWMGLKPARGRKERDSVILMKVVVVMIKRRKMR